MTLTDLFRFIALATAIGVPLFALRERGRSYAIFAGVAIGISLPGAVISHARLIDWLPTAAEPWLSGFFSYCMAATGVQFARLVRARMRSPLFRVAVSVPGQAFLAAGFMAGVWLLALLPLRLILGALGFEGILAWLRPLDALPFLVALVSIRTSTQRSTEIVRVRLGQNGPEKMVRVPVERHRGRAAPPLAERPLRIVQITDPHLGPWQPVAGLQRALEALLAREPDLVLLTGDFLTMEGQGTPGALREALAPLRDHPAPAFAIFGNHDLEAPDEVRDGLESARARLLIDEEALIQTPVGPVQIVGADYVRRKREQHIQDLLARYPRRDDAVRLLLLHDPLGFQHVPAGEVDLTLSGHTHGGQVGLLSFGLDWTVLTRSRWPDHGLFARGSNRLYVHRGTGFYGFPLRVGVPPEHSVLELVLPSRISSADPVQ